MLIILPWNSYGQLAPSTDSLEALLLNASGQHRVEVLLDLSSQLRRSNIDSALVYAREALGDANQIADEYLIAESHRNLGWLLTSHNYPQALKNLLQAKRMFEQVGDLQKEAQTLVDLGYLYRSQSNYNKSLEYYFSALNLQEQLDDKQRIASILNWIGITNQHMKQPEESIRFYERALKISEQLNDASDMAEYATNLGNAYASTGKTEQAMEVFEKALDASEQLPGAHAKATILMNISSVYNDKQSYRQAIEINNQALTLAREMSDKMLEALALENMASVYRSQGALPKANDHLLQTLPLLNDIGWQQTLIGIRNQLAHNYFDLGEFNRAIRYATEALEVAQKSTMYEEALESLQLLSDAYGRADEYEKAISAQRKIIALKDSLYSREKSRQIAQMQARYETEQKEQEIALLQEKQERAQLIRNAFIAGLLLIAIIALLVYNRQRLKIKKNKTELENTRLKEQQLKRDLAFKNKQLTTHSLHLVQKNEAMKELKEHICEINQQGDGRNTQDLQSLTNLVDYSFNLDKDWEEFRLYFEEVHTGFFATLKEQYPDLTSKELRLSALVKLNLTTKEIATLLGITPNSVKTARYRLRKKLGMETEENLTDFMMSVEKEVSNIE
ncbi:tetratricopeptide repeat protein [Fodinibius salsisoli]|uniref:Tetratricopeptide repeat protein n=1 Tax=Fodinibius salsisoli TaxID=2820877 RepID=A0ABT3PJK8_9BACT|nr:tetratricopeptide repeat protein [Fodinibius salsisoli]MCW9706132.1 tetratricopeptide repeat protein [Fodinibius salsisoli]